MVDADRERDSFDFFIGVQRIGTVLPGILRLALERQHGLELLVPRLLGRTAGGITFYNEQLVSLGILRGTVGQLARQNRYARQFTSFNFLRGPSACAGLRYNKLGNALAFVYMLVQP